jgi:hypothetical protein
VSTKCLAANGLRRSMPCLIAAPVMFESGNERVSAYYCRAVLQNKLSVFVTMIAVTESHVIPGHLTFEAIAAKMIVLCNKTHIAEVPR